MSDSPQSEHQWRWPNKKNFSPTTLKTYSECASRVKMQHLQKLEPPEKWVRAFAVGRTTHNALRTIAAQLSVGASEFITDEQIRNLCRFEMPLREYPTAEAHEADIRLVISWIRKGQAWLQSLDVVEWLRIEQYESRNLTMFSGEIPYSMSTRPDLVLKQIDEDGEPYFHILDWKTGAVWELPDVPVIMRYALHDRLENWAGDANAANVKFTWFWLDHDFRKSVDVSYEHSTYRWPDIVKQMKSLALETEWKATPGRYCVYCPYYKNHCPEEIPPGEDW